jgi:ribonucleoside-triphosphate reductase
VDDLTDLLYLNLVGGEPGFVNALAAQMKCPWFVLMNPCFEILLPRMGFCNLVSLALPLFNRNMADLLRAVYIMSRANYRQSCVNLRDGILQPAWHQTNEALRLCGVSFTGIVQAPWLTDYDIRRLRNMAINGAYSMAHELNGPIPKAVTTIKPEGTRSKITGMEDFELAEGMHNPPGEFMFNWINFAALDPMVRSMELAGLKTIPSPSDVNNILVRFPIRYSGCPFEMVNGKRVNNESALSQLRRYRRWNNGWADHNVSATISLDREEVPAVAKWIHRNWDKGYIATAFTQRIDPTLIAADVGHPYLPQEVVTEEVYNEAMASIKPVDWESGHTGWYDIDESDCARGVCPTK